MPPEIDDYPLTPFREALTSLTGTLIGAALVSMVAGAMPVLAYKVAEWVELGWMPNMEFGFFWALSMAWIGHWIVSGIAIWGFLFSLVHVFYLNRMIQGAGDPYMSLAVLFCNQTIVSTIVLSWLVWDGREFWAVLVSGVVSLVLGAGFAFWIARAARKRS